MFGAVWGQSDVWRVGKAWRRALQWLCEIKEEGLDQGLLSYKAALKVLEKEGRWQEADVDVYTSTSSRYIYRYILYIYMIYRLYIEAIIWVIASISPVCNAGR